MAAWHDGERDVALETARLDAAARVIASIAAEPAAHDDRQGAFRALRAIGQMPDVEYARIEGANGRLLVETGSGARLTSDVQSGNGASREPFWQRLFSQSSEITAPIIFDQHPVGRVVLLGRTTDMFARFMGSLSGSFGIAALACIIGLLIAWRLQEAIARPVVALTDEMARVQTTHDFGRRVEIAADGEVETLVGGFNRMLSEIRSRDARIAAQMAGLESEVEARTAELVVAKDAAEAANSAKSDFLATMSHEIRTPMNGVMAMAEMLAAGELPARERRFAQVIASSGASLLAIINDILDFSKIEAGKLELESMPVDLTQTVDDVLSLFWDRASGKGLDLAAYVDPAIPRLVAGDPVRIRQVISNLVNNAIKFTEKGGVMVEIAPNGGGRIRIDVRDTGIGIAPGKIGSVFGAFTQADQSTTRRFGGTGLGLAICKKLVDAMDGAFEVTSKLGEGSSFAFDLPARIVEAAEPWPKLPPVSRVMLEPGIGVTREVLERYLSAAGAEFGDSGTTLAIGHADFLRAHPDAPVRICLGAIGDSQPREMLREGEAAAILSLPLRRAEIATILRSLADGVPLTQAQNTDSAGGTQELPSFAGARVLVADDSAVNREVAMEALSRFGIDADVVADGWGAVAAAAAKTYDLLLMDGSMPGMDGYDAAREIRRVETRSGRPPLKIVALTAHVVGAAADAWKSAGMDGVLHKPFTLKALGETLARFLVPAAPQAGAELHLADEVPAEIAAMLARAQASALFDAEVIAQLRAFAQAGRSGFVETVCKLYRENAPICVTDMRAALQAGSVERLANAAHALKSMSYNMGARAVATATASIEGGALGGELASAQAIATLDGALSQTLVILAVETSEPMATGGPGQRTLALAAAVQ